VTWHPYLGYESSFSLSGEEARHGVGNPGLVQDGGGYHDHHVSSRPTSDTYPWGGRRKSASLLVGESRYQLTCWGSLAG